MAATSGAEARTWKEIIFFIKGEANFDAPDSEMEIARVIDACRSAGFEAEDDRIKGEFRMLQLMHEQGKARRPEVGVLTNGEVADLDVWSDKLIAALMTVKRLVADRERLTAEVERHRLELAKLKDRLRSAAEGEMSLTKECDSLRVSCEKLGREVEQVKQQVATTTAERDEARSSVDNLTAQLEDGHRVLGDAMETVRTLSAANAQAKEEIARSTASHQEEVARLKGAQAEWLRQGLAKLEEGGT